MKYLVRKRCHIVIHQEQKLWLERYGNGSISRGVRRLLAEKTNYPQLTRIKNKTKKKPVEKPNVIKVTKIYNNSKIINVRVLPKEPPPPGCEYKLVKDY